MACLNELRTAGRPAAAFDGVRIEASVVSMGGCASRAAGSQVLVDSQL